MVTANSKKTDIRKQGLESIKDDVVKANLMGVSRKMDKKGWTDAQGRKGKVLCTSHATGRIFAALQVASHRYKAVQSSSLAPCMVTDIHAPAKGSGSNMHIWAVCPARMSVPV